MLAYLSLICLGVTPFLVYYFGKRLLTRRLGMLDHEQKAIASLFDQYRQTDIAGVNYTVLFFFRRFAMLAILTMLPTWRNAQINA